MIKPNKTLVLAGFMGVGKTTLARLLSERYNLEYCDLDNEIHKSTGLSSADYIRQFGEHEFRNIELATLQQILLSPPEIIALGGGTLHIQGCLELLDGCCVIVLESPYDVLKHRILDGDRPLAQLGVALYEQRQELFETMPLRLETSEYSISESCDNIIEIWKGYGAT